MNQEHDQVLLKRFDDALRKQASVPPVMSADTAADRLLRRISARRPKPWYRTWTLLPLALSTAGAAALLLVTRSPEPERILTAAVTPVHHASAPDTAPVNMMVFWLDSETPLYMSLKTFDSQGDIL